MKMLDVQQGTDEWLQARLGIITASNAHVLLVNGKAEHGLGAGAITYMYQLLAERFMGYSDEPFKGNEYTERGHLLEPIVADYYQRLCGVTPHSIGIILNHADLVGCDVGASPDRLVGDVGGLEIKTRQGKLQAELLCTGNIDNNHLTQVQFNLWVSGRQWWDYVSFCQDMPLFIKRFYPDNEMHKQFEIKSRVFYQLLDEKMAKMINA